MKKRIQLVMAIFLYLSVNLKAQQAPTKLFDSLTYSCDTAKFKILWNMTANVNELEQYHFNQEKQLKIIRYDLPYLKNYRVLNIYADSTENIHVQFYTVPLSLKEKIDTQNIHFDTLNYYLKKYNVVKILNESFAYKKEVNCKIYDGTDLLVMAKNQNCNNLVFLGFPCFDPFYHTYEKMINFFEALSP